MLQPSSSLEGAEVRAAVAVRERVGVPMPGVPAVGVPAGLVTVGDPLPAVGVVVRLPDVLVGAPVGDPVDAPLGVAVGPSPIVGVGVPSVGVPSVGVPSLGDSVGVTVGASSGVEVGVSERAVIVGLGSTAGVSSGLPGNVSASISARLLNPSPSESASSIGANSCAEAANAAPYGLSAGMSV